MPSNENDGNASRKRFFPIHKKMHNKIFQKRYGHEILLCRFIIGGSTVLRFTDIGVLRANDS